MSRATRLARRSKAEERHAEDYARERFTMVRAAGGDKRMVAVALMTVGTLWCGRNPRTTSMRTAGERINPMSV